MEKINQSIRKKFPQVKLYLDDLTRIIDILEDNNFKMIEISTSTHKYGKEELAIIPNSSSISEITSHDPFYFSIDFNDGFGDGICIYSGSDSVLAEGIIQKLGKIFLIRRRFFPFLVTKYWVAIGIQFIIILFCFYFLAHAKISVSTYFILCFGGVILALFLMFLDSGKLIRKNIFYYKKKDDQPSFWIRKKDEIIVGLIVALVSVTITVIVTKLTK